ncbi:MAG TPA: aminotransferase class V-fold PLP-dependent enzyme [Gemmatimonadetes bacterium]|nr:aminotransferase class V-fold PLP-dependent enzyme [Gemmatimonadota bacterium]
MDVLKIREQIPVCQNMTYVNTGWSGPSPFSVVKAIKDRLDLEMNQGPTTSEVYQAGRDIQANIKTAMADLINASVDELCVTRNTTEGLNIVMNGLTWEEGDEIITCDLEHSSVLIPSYYQQHRHGAVVKVLQFNPNENRESILEKISDAITDRTKMVFLSHVEYSTGLRMPVKEIRQLTKSREIFMLLDGAQSAGHIALDMKDLDCDFYSIPGQKWLLGPEGVGALYIRQDLISQVQPTFVAGRSSLSPGNPYGFEPNVESMDKFLLTSTSVALQAGALEAIRFVNDPGVAAIEERGLDLSTILKQALVDVPGINLLSPMDRQDSTGLVSLTVDGMTPEEAVNRLWQEHRIVCRQVSFPPGLRISLHFFNTEEEVEQVVEALKRLV